MITRKKYELEDIYMTMDAVGQGHVLSTDNAKTSALIYDALEALYTRLEQEEQTCDTCQYCDESSSDFPCRNCTKGKHNYWREASQKNGAQPEKEN